jgi:hypothetical protein
VNDFMSTGGDGFTMFNGLGWKPSGLTCLEAVVEWLRRQPQPVRGDATARIAPVARPASRAH